MYLLNCQTLATQEQADSVPPSRQSSTTDITSGGRSSRESSPFPSTRPSCRHLLAAARNPHAVVAVAAAPAPEPRNSLELAPVLGMMRARLLELPDKLEPRKAHSSRSVPSCLIAGAHGQLSFALRTAELQAMDNSWPQDKKPVKIHLRDPLLDYFGLF